MPKQKTHRGAAKRFSSDQDGQVSSISSMNCQPSGALNKKTTKRTRHLRAGGVAAEQGRGSLPSARCCPYK